MSSPLCPSSIQTKRDVVNSVNRVSIAFYVYLSGKREPTHKIIIFRVKSMTIEKIVGCYKTNSIARGIFKPNLIWFFFKTWKQGLEVECGNQICED